MATKLRIATLAGLVLLAAGLATAQDESPAPPAGTWKVNMPTLRDGGSSPVLLLKFEKDKDGKWKGAVLASRLPGLDTVEKVVVKEKLTTFTVKGARLTLNFEVKFGDAKVAKHHGEASQKRDAYPIELTRSALTSLGEYAVIREEMAGAPLGANAVILAYALIGKAEENKAKTTDVRAWAEKAYKSAQLYGPRFTRETLLNLARGLAEQKGMEATAVQYAKRAEAGLDEKAEGPAAVKEVLDVLMEVLEKAEKKEDAAAVLVRIKKLDFRVKPVKYAGRKGKSDRAALAEVFTTSQSSSDATVNMILSGLAKTFGGKELNVLAYHQHQAENDKGELIGDPLACNDSEERLADYKRDVRKLPVIILNGKLTVQAGGAPEDAQDGYAKIVEMIGPMLEKDAKAKLALTATRKGDKVEITANVSDPAETGEDIKLRVALVETEATYKGKGGGNVHYNVVRAMPGTHEGTAVKQKKFEKKFTVDLAELRKQYEKYYTTVAKTRPFPNKERPLELKKLRVIAFVQNDANNEVLQSAQADVKGE